MKKVLAIMLLLAIATGLFAGCGKDSGSGTGKNGSNTSAASTSEIIPVSDDMFTKDKIVFVDGGKAVYNIVKPESCSKITSETAAKLFKQMKTALDASSKNITDANDGTDSYEILIGNTNRSESAAALQYLSANSSMRKDDFLIGSIGKKIVIVGTNDEAVDAAADYFIANLLKKEGVEGGILYVNLTDTSNMTDRNINGVALGHFKIVRPHYNSSYITQMEMEKLVNTVKEKFGYSLSIVEDAYEAPGEYEIIVGNTNRDGVSAITDRDIFQIRIEGTKVYLNGGHSYSTAAAVTEFTKLLLDKDITNDMSVSAGSYNTVVATYDKSTYFTPVWYDDFDGTTIDTKKWSVIKPGGSDSTGYDNKRCVRSADPSITFVRDGLFQVHPFQDDTTYYGGMLRTDTTMSYTFGFAETSEIIPNAPGFWTSLWCCSDDPDTLKIQSPEIDINESFGDGTVYGSNCHRWPCAANPIQQQLKLEHTSFGFDRKSLDGRTYNDDFHTYGFLWDETQLTFTCDGEIHASYDITQENADTECFTHSLYFILSMAVGFANNSQDIRKATAEDWQSDKCCLFVDYVYVYQLKDGKQKLVTKG